MMTASFLDSSNETNFSPRRLNKRLDSFDLWFDDLAQYGDEDDDNDISPSNSAKRLSPTPERKISRNVSNASSLYLDHDDEDLIPLASTPLQGVRRKHSGDLEKVFNSSLRKLQPVEPVSPPSSPPSPPPSPPPFSSPSDKLRSPKPTTSERSTPAARPKKSKASTSESSKASGGENTTPRMSRKQLLQTIENARHTRKCLSPRLTRKSQATTRGSSDSTSSSRRSTRTDTGNGSPKMSSTPSTPRRKTITRGKSPNPKAPTSQINNRKELSNSRHSTGSYQESTTSSTGRKPRSRRSLMAREQQEQIRRSASLGRRSDHSQTSAGTSTSRTTRLRRSSLSNGNLKEEVVKSSSATRSSGRRPLSTGNLKEEVKSSSAATSPKTPTRSSERRPLSTGNLKEEVKSSSAKSPTRSSESCRTVRRGRHGVAIQKQQRSSSLGGRRCHSRHRSKSITSRNTTNN